MQRAAEERHRAVLEHQQYQSRHRDDTRDLPVNLFRKSWRRAGCLKTRCFLCKYEKLLSLPTAWELRAADRQQDGEREF